MACEGLPVDAIPCSRLRTLAIATAPKALRVEGWPSPRDGAWPSRILAGGEAHRAPRSITLRELLPPDACGLVQLPLASRYEVVYVLVAMALIVLRPPAVHPSGGLRAEVPPALVATRRVAPLRAGAEPLLGERLGLLRSPLPAG